MLATITAPEPLPTTLQTVEEFEQWERLHHHETNFEFVRGRILPKPAMKQDEFDIADFLLRQFIQTPQFQQKHLLLSEGDSYIDGKRKRIPDLTYITAAQREAIRRGERVNTLFAIEILSDSESHEDVLEKIQDYFDGGTQLVWYITPRRKRIYAYTSPLDIHVFANDDVVTAAPVIPELTFSLPALFV
jgi:Uma2 family endonuclease